MNLSITITNICSFSTCTTFTGMSQMRNLPYNTNTSVEKYIELRNQMINEQSKKVKSAKETEDYEMKLMEQNPKEEL